MVDMKRLLDEKLEPMHKARYAVWSYLECLVEKKLNPVYKIYYAAWVYWWPLWRSIFSGRRILRNWRRFDLVQEGQTFLDYGCGTGFFTIAAASIVGVKGKAYALDCFPRQLEIVEKRSGKKGLANIETILSECEIDLPDECIDVAWMCDVFHEIERRRAVLEEIHRVLREEGVLVIYDGMKDKVLSYTKDLFSLNSKDGKLLRFVKSNQT